MGTPRKSRHATDEYDGESVQAPPNTIFAIDIKTKSAGYYRYQADGGTQGFTAVQELPEGAQAWPPGMLEWGSWPNPGAGQSLC